MLSFKIEIRRMGFLLKWLFRFLMSGEKRNWVKVYVIIIGLVYFVDFFRGICEILVISFGKDGMMIFSLMVFRVIVIRMKRSVVWECCFDMV